MTTAVDSAILIDIFQADALLTRDRGFYRRYFKRLRIIEPS